MDEPLPDEAVVVRGGTNQLQHVREQAIEAFETEDRYVLSGNADHTMTLDQLLRAARRPNPKVSLSTVGRLRAAGCEVEPPTGKRRHVTIVLPQPPAEDDYISFCDAFDPPQRNPHRGEAKR